MAVITGKVVNVKTGQPVYNAHVIFTNNNGEAYSPLVGTATDFDGNYSFDTLGGYYLKVTHLGYSDMVKPINLSQFQSGGDYKNNLNFELEPSSYQLPEIVISDKIQANANTWFEENKGGILAISGIVLITYVLLNSKK
jgi:hypothetical protein